MMALSVLMSVHMRVFRNLSDPTWHAQAAEDAATQPPWDVRVALRTERCKVGLRMPRNQSNVAQGVIESVSTRPAVLCPSSTRLLD